MVGLYYMMGIAGGFLLLFLSFADVPSLTYVCYTYHLLLVNDELVGGDQR